MIECKLEDFEKHRANLTRYAKGLLLTRGFSNHKYAELDELAKDIVQNSYLSFQTSSLTCFVTDLHFESFLKLCLYRAYLDEMNFKSRNAQWILFKKGEFDQLDMTKHPRTVMPSEQFDLIAKFKEELTPHQSMIVDKLLEGFSQADIAKETGVSRQSINSDVVLIRKKYGIY